MEKKEKIYRRKIEDVLVKHLDRKEMLGIKGARQVGKTTLLKIIYEKTKAKKNFINMDLPEMRRTMEENPVDIVKRYKEERKKLYLFIDEIQRVKNAGEKLKIIYDEFQDVKILFSGSSSLELKAEILPFLVGRAFIFELYSFDFEEFLQTKDEGLLKIFREKNESLRKTIDDHDEPQPPSFESEFLHLLKEYLVFGGYPEVLKTEDKETKEMILKNIYSLYIEKDIISYFGIKETTKFEDMLKMLAFRISSLLSITSIASALKTNFHKVEEYLEILKHTYIIHLLRPFYRNLVTELRKTQKLYFLDLGLRNAVINNFVEFDNRPDGGALLENFVFRELFTCGYSINYWRTTGKTEIDFIIKENGNVVPIEVKLTETKLGKGFRSFINTYKPEVAILVTMDEFGKDKIDSCKIYKVPAYYL